MPDEPRSFEEVVDSLKDHPEWRRNLREMFPDVAEPEPPPDQGSRVPRWLATLGVGVLIGGIAAGVAVFALVNDDDDDDGGGDTAIAAATAAETPAVTPAPSASPATPAANTTPAAAATPSPEATRNATAAPQATSAPLTPTPTAAVTPQRTATQPAPQPSPAQPTQPVASATTATAAPSGGPVFSFAGFEGACAPITALVRIENVTRTISMSGEWRGGAGTVITVTSPAFGPQAPGDVVTVGFPTVSPLTPGLYTFTAIADGQVVASGSTQISC